MKHNELRSIAHNIADSFASGMGFLIGVYGTDIFAEARKSPEGFITVDFLNGTSTGGPTSASLAKAIKLYSEALPGFCEKHGSSASFFQALSVQYDARSMHVFITIEDKKGRQSMDEYEGTPLKHLKTTRTKRE